MAASAQKEKLKIKLTKEENAAYIKLFETYSEEHRSKKDKIIVSAQTVKDLFNKSGLKNTALMRIYELSQQSQKDYLEKIEFVTALKLISIYQNFGSLDNHETLLQAKVSLVKLEGINHNFKESKGIKESNLNNFYSDKLEEDLDFDNNQKQDKSNKEEASPGLKRNISSSHEYDTLDNIKTDNKIKRYFQQIAQIMEINNPGSQCEIYLREKIQKLQGIIIALEERKTYIKNYATKIEQKYIKNERLSKIEFDSSMKFELNHEIEMLNKDIDDLKISILQQNANLIKEIDKLEDTKASQLKKLMIAQGLTLHISFKKIKSFMLENPDFYSVQEQNSEQNNQYLGSQNIIDHTLNQQDSNIVIQDQQQVNEFLNNSRKQSFDQDQRINQNIIGGNNDIYEQYDNLDD